jgi:hypothetical protein
MDFEMKGELQKITYVELQIGEGEKRIASAALPVAHPKPGSATVSFSAFPKYLPETSLMIVVHNGPKGDVGYRFKLKDFLELEKQR